jgi:hypothetical protein
LSRTSNYPAQRCGSRLSEEKGFIDNETTFKTLLPDPLKVDDIVKIRLDHLRTKTSMLRKKKKKKS